MQLMFRAFSIGFFGAGIAVAVAASGALAMPSLLWSGVEQVRTVCTVKNAPPTKEVAICRQFARAVAERSPYPVNNGAGKPTDLIVRFEGDVTASSRVTGHILASRFTARGEGDDSTRPLPISFMTTFATGQQKAALSAALDRLLPWRQRNLHPQQGRAN
ncbi:MAG: hypothetical protein RLZZ366_624 [Pseudomonadota bacterium]